jgi:Spy/CpxP family protein refolding chaperone
MRAIRLNLRHGGEGFGWHGVHGKAGMRALIEELDLSSDQRHAIRAKVQGELKQAFPAVREQRLAMRERARAAAYAFQSDQFNATELGLGRDSLAARRELLALKLRVVEAALPSLSPTQRETLSAHFRSHGAP